MVIRKHKNKYPAVFIEEGNKTFGVHKAGLSMRAIDIRITFL